MSVSTGYVPSLPGSGIPNIPRLSDETLRAVDILDMVVSLMMPKESASFVQDLGAGRIPLALQTKMGDSAYVAATRQGKDTEAFVLHMNNAWYVIHWRDSLHTPHAQVGTSFSAEDKQRHLNWAKAQIPVRLIQRLAGLEPGVSLSPLTGSAIDYHRAEMGLISEVHISPQAYGSAWAVVSRISSYFASRNGMASRWGLMIPSGEEVLDAFAQDSRRPTMMAYPSPVRMRVGLAGDIPVISTDAQVRTTQFPVAFMGMIRGGPIHGGVSHMMPPVMARGVDISSSVAREFAPRVISDTDIERMLFESIGNYMRLCDLVDPQLNLPAEVGELEIDQAINIGLFSEKQAHAYNKRVHNGAFTIMGVQGTNDRAAAAAGANAPVFPAPDLDHFLSLSEHGFPGGVATMIRTTLSTRSFIGVPAMIVGAGVGNVLEIPEERDATTKLGVAYAVSAVMRTAPVIVPHATIVGVCTNQGEEMVCIPANLVMVTPNVVGAPPVELFMAVLARMEAHALPAAFQGDAGAMQIASALFTPRYARSVVIGVPPTADVDSFGEPNAYLNGLARHDDQVRRMR